VRLVRADEAEAIRAGVGFLVHAHSVTTEMNVAFDTVLLNVNRARTKALTVSLFIK